MKQVSADFMRDIYASTRQTRVSLTFPFVDPDAKEAATVESVAEPAEIGDPAQCMDGQYDLVGRVAQFEPGYWRLDGSFVLPLPGGQTASRYGYWSEELSDENGEYPAGMGMRLHFSRPITIPGLTLFFDQATDNYLTDFDCIAYDQNRNVLRREEVRGNMSTRCVLEKGVVALKYIDLVFLRSSQPCRRVRISEIDFGIMLVFEGANLLSASLVAECDPLVETMPGNELNFVAINDGKFDYANPESYSKYLQRRQQFEYRHSLVLEDGRLEHVDMGIYALQSWKVSDSKIEIKARMDFSALEERAFRRYSLTEWVNCGQLMERIFEDCGWGDYELDPYLYDSPLMLPYTGEVNCKEALRMATQLAGAVVMKLPSGTIAVRRVMFDSPEVVDGIDYDNSLAAPQAASSRYYNAVSLTVTMASGKDTPQGKPIAVFAGEVTDPGGEQAFVVPFDYILYDDAPEVEIVGGSIVAGSQRVYANYAFFTVRAAGAFTITIRGRTVEFNKPAEVVYHAPWYQEGEELHAYRLKLPMLLQGEQHEALRGWCVAERLRVLGYRLTTESSWRQNPAGDIGDYVNIQLDKSDERVPVMAVKQTLKYSGGALRGSTTAIGQGRMTMNNGG